MTPTLKAALGLLVVAALGVGGLYGTRYLLASGGTAEAEEPADSGPVRVGVAAPEERVVDDDVSLVGTLMPVRMVDLAPSVAGRVAEIPVTSGQDVAEGDLVLRLDDAAERAALAEAEATYSAARQDFDRVSQLNEDGTAAEAQLETSRAAFSRAEAVLESARADLEDRRIVAPFGGTLGIVDVDPGAYLDAGTVVTRLSDLSTMEVDAPVPERYYERATPGRAMRVTTPSYPDSRFEGEVTVRDPSIDRASQSFVVRAEIANPGRRLAGGMFANATLILGQSDSLVVPDDAIIGEGLTNYVYVVEDGTARRREVSLGASLGEGTEITDGLGPDDRVVVAGWDRLSGGETVEIAENVPEEGLE